MTVKLLISAQNFEIIDLISELLNFIGFITRILMMISNEYIEYDGHILCVHVPNRMFLSKSLESRDFNMIKAREMNFSLTKVDPDNQIPKF